MWVEGEAGVLELLGYRVFANTFCQTFRAPLLLLLEAARPVRRAGTLQHQAPWARVNAAGRDGMPGMAANSCSLRNVSGAVGNGRPGMEISRHHHVCLREADKEQT